MRTALLLTVTILLPSAALAGEPIAPREKVVLFNGRDLTGWTTWLVDAKEIDPRGVYKLEKGLLRISGDGYGYLATREAYRDYRLVVEYRWGDASRPERKEHARDSGIFLHAVGPDGNSFDGDGAYKAAIECQVMEGAVGDLMLIKGKDHDGREVPVRFSASVAREADANGWPYWSERGDTRKLSGFGRLNRLGKSRDWKDVRDFRGDDDPESPLDQWTRVECVCRDDTIEVYVNDRLVNRAHDVFPRSGQLLLQCEGSEIFFRRVELLPLDDAPQEPKDR